jgi:RNA polymerase sigma factor (sigma-70 family)
VPATDDTALVDAARGGDRTAFGRLIERYEQRATAVARRLLGEREEAKDVVQEATLHAYLGLDQLRDPQRFGSWLCGITINLARMRLRRARTGVSLDEAGGRRLEAATAPPPEGMLEELEAVRAALAVLPAGQRQLVFMHYIEGLSCEDIAALLGRSNGAVRVGLHRARSRLRRHLLAEEEAMVEVEIEDVVVRMLAEDQDPPQLASDMRVVLLREKGGDRILPIWIGAIEGDALALALARELGLRPLSADLMARMLEATGGRIERVAINSLREKTFYATVYLGVDGKAEELDSRPSDAINLAQRVDAPIFVEDEVMQANAIGSRDSLDAEAERVLGEPPEGEWRPLSPDLVRTLWEAKLPK